MAKPAPCVLLVERETDLADLNALILAANGYRVEKVSPAADLVSVVERTHPEVIVVGLSPNEPAQWAIVDHLNDNPRTRAIPLVVISPVERAVAEAGAAPNVRYSVVMPYDIATLEGAVSTALKHPPPAAVLPKPSGPVPRFYVVATDGLSHDARAIVLNTIRQLQKVDPYKSRFQELTPELVDHLGTILGAILGGIRNGLAPEKVFTVPEIHRAIREHVELRIKQQLGPIAAIHEDQILRDQIDRRLRALVGTSGLTAEDALAVSSIVNDYVDALQLMILTEFGQTHAGRQQLAIASPPPPTAPRRHGQSAPSDRSHHAG